MDESPEVVLVDDAYYATRKPDAPGQQFQIAMHKGHVCNVHGHIAGHGHAHIVRAAEQLSEHETEQRGTYAHSGRFEVHVGRQTVGGPEHHVQGAEEIGDPGAQRYGRGMDPHCDIGSRCVHHADAAELNGDGLQDHGDDRLAQCPGNAAAISP